VPKNEHDLLFTSPGCHTTPAERHTEKPGHRAEEVVTGLNREVSLSAIIERLAGGSGSLAADHLPTEPSSLAVGRKE